MLVVGIGLTLGLAGAASADVPGAGAADKAPAVKVMLNGGKVDFADGAPYLDGQAGQVFVPLRHISTALGADVDWQAETKTAVVRQAGKNIEMTVNQKQPLVDGAPGKALDAPAQLRNGRVMVPLRFVSETLGYAVVWSGENSTVSITAPAAKPKAVNVNERLVQSATDEAEVNMRIPVLSGLADPALEKEINAAFLQKAEDFRGEVLAGFAEYKEAMEQTGGPVRPYAVDTAYTENYNQDGLLSLTVEYYQFTGGAHGSTLKETLNLDVDSGRVLTMADFLGPDYKDIVVREIQKQIAAHPERYFTHELGFDGIEDARDTAARIAADQQFYIADGKIVVYFQQYDIAPYAAGFPEFAVPVTAMPAA